MLHYISIGAFQAHVDRHYQRYGTKMPFNEAALSLYNSGQLRSTFTSPQPRDLYDDLTDAQFDALLDCSPLVLDMKNFMENDEHIHENHIIPDTRDVFVFRHFHHTNGLLHSHDYFELSYVLKGSCIFTFEKTSRLLHAGELCIIASGSMHDLEVEEDDATVITICIRKSTFYTTFFSLMSQKDLLSYFFRTILCGDSHSNYLLFFTKNNEAIKKVIKNLTMENLRSDAYSNNSCISWVNLLLTIILRNYSETIQFYNYEIGADFSLILQYIQHNYLTLSLSRLAEVFHYSEPHLSTLIRKNTGHHFSDLVKRLKLADAVDYLLNTDLKISEIAERVGYNSADHFSRVFRTEYQISPLDYRRRNKLT